MILDGMPASSARHVSEQVLNGVCDYFLDRFGADRVAANREITSKQPVRLIRRSDSGPFPWSASGSAMARHRHSEPIAGVGLIIRFDQWVMIVPIAALSALSVPGSCLFRKKPRELRPTLWFCLVLQA
ncbi:hypothetical protein [Mesorhizobium sp. IMUNJ 23232]|uniref:hypothetical protein n=1 Tax=Mesorhizobium sp. IMUNJ 23232 TaxID=3376064 RepID=UPI0037A9F01E